MRYLVIQIVESASSICVHILLNVFKEKVEGFPECFVRLQLKNILPKDLAEKLSSAARLRNLLVHRYRVILDEKVYQSVRDGLKDFEQFILHVRRFLSKDPINENKNLLKQEFMYCKLSKKEKERILNMLKKKLMCYDEVVFAYVYGGFIERDVFRDIDVGIWVRDKERAFYYAVDISAKLGLEVGFPVDLQVINQAPLPFKYHVFTGGKLILSKNEKLRHEIVNLTVRKYLDLKGLASFT